jgi:hypothetical protein
VVPCGSAAVWQCAAVCGSACGSVRQCGLAATCTAVQQRAAVHATVCGGACGSMCLSELSYVLNGIQLILILVILLFVFKLPRTSVHYVVN